MEFIYKTVLIDRLFFEENWTEEDERITSEHFQFLLDLKDKNQLVLAGKTQGLDLSTYGIVIFKANNYTEALKVMNQDPAIKNGIMTGTLHEYSLAIFNPDYTKKDE